MLCFRVILWGITLFILLIPGIFLVSIIGRVMGFRPGTRVGDTEKVFGWVGIVVLGGLMLGICVVAGLIDWGVNSVADRVQNMPRPLPHQHVFNPPIGPIGPHNHTAPAQDQAKPKPINATWVDAKMTRTFLGEMPEIAPRVGWGGFGKRGKLGYDVFGNTDIKVAGKLYANGISMHPPTAGFSTVTYRLHRESKLFIAWAALSDVENAGFVPASPATFCVLGDNQLLWVSNPLQQAGTSQHCRLSVENVDVLELQIHCTGSNSHVRGVWLEPHVLK